MRGLASPHPSWGAMHGGNVDIISRPLYLAVNCSVSLASEHTYADFWEMIPGIVSAFYLFGSGYTYGVSLRGFPEEFHTFFLRSGSQEMTSCLSPYSALSLVQQWIHELRLFPIAWDFTDFLREGGLGPCGGRCPGVQVELFHGCRQKS